MSLKNIVLIGAAGFLIGFYLWPDSKSLDDQGAPMVSITLPDLSPKSLTGQKIFQEKCSVCHGDNAVGRNEIGPPLIHIIYEPSHHSDQSFYLAAKNGVRAHHWTFGNMPAIEDITDREIEEITYFIREVQRANGIE